MFLWSWLWKNLPAVGDILAIPFFLLQVMYFGGISQKSPVEWLLYLFGITGLAADVMFTARFLGGT